MKVDLEFIGQLKKHKFFNVIDQIPNTDNVYEYAIEEFEEGQVTGTIYLEYEVIDSFDRNLGNFGVNFEHKVFIYNLKRETIKDNIVRSEKNEKGH
jgi:hypothetical protein